MEKHNGLKKVSLFLTTCLSLFSFMNPKYYLKMMRKMRQNDIN